jgi:hypothetical protein
MRLMKSEERNLTPENLQIQAFYTVGAAINFCLNQHPSSQGNENVTFSLAYPHQSQLKFTATLSSIAAPTEVS